MWGDGGRGGCLICTQAWKRERERVYALMRKKKELMVIAMIASVAYDGSTGRSEIPAQSAWPVEEIPRVCLES